MTETQSPAPQPAGKAKVSKHTPGPWEYDAENYEIYYDDGYALPCIARLDNDCASEEEDDADGRLIAAAPDLLAALLSLVNVAPQNSDDDDPQQAAAWNAVRAAIAKATGDAA